MSIVVRRVGTDAISIVGDPPDTHEFLQQWVNRHLEEGRVSLSRGRIVLHDVDSDVAYRIVRGPGAYCVLCGERLGDSPATTDEVTEQRAAHVDACEGTNDPDPENPAGHYFAASYLTELEG